MMAATASVTMLLSPVVAKADGPASNMVRTYKDLRNQKYEYSDIEAQTNFGWPSSKTTVNLKNFQLWKSWLIPSQVTVNQTGYIGWSTEDIPLIIQGSNHHTASCAEALQRRFPKLQQDQPNHHQQ